MSAHSNLTQVLISARSAGAGITLSAEQLDALFADPAILSEEDDMIEIDEILRKTKMSRSTLLRLRKDNQFIEPVRTSVRRVVFRRAEFNRWLSQRQA